MAFQSTVSTVPVTSAKKHSTRPREHLENRLPSSIVLDENILQFKSSLKAIGFSYVLLGKD